MNHFYISIFTSASSKLFGTVFQSSLEFRPYPRFFSRQRGHAKASHVENPPFARLHVPPSPTAPRASVHPPSPFYPFSSRRFISSGGARFRAHKSPRARNRKHPPSSTFLLAPLPVLALHLLRGSRPFFSPHPVPVSRFSRLEGTRAGGGWKFRTNLHVALLTISSFGKKTQASSRLSIKEMTLNNISSSLPCEILSIMPIADL